MVLDVGYSTLSRAVGAAIKGATRFDTVSDDLAAAMIANGRELVDRALEAVESMLLSGSNHVKRKVIIVTAHFTRRHFSFSLLVAAKKRTAVRQANSFETRSYCVETSASSVPQVQLGGGRI
jgi:hypothetical protein